MFKYRCYNGGDKHKFKERYNSKEIPDLEETGEPPKLILREYIHDICTWCGKVIKHEALSNR